MCADHAITVIVKNCTNHRIYLKGSGFPSGKGTFMQDLSTPAEISSGDNNNPGVGAWRGENTAFLAAPVEGWAIYEFGDRATKLNINFIAEAGARPSIKAAIEGPLSGAIKCNPPVVSDEACATGVFAIVNK